MNALQNFSTTYIIVDGSDDLDQVLGVAEEFLSKVVTLKKQHTVVGALRVLNNLDGFAHVELRARDERTRKCLEDMTKHAIACKEKHDLRYRAIDRVIGLVDEK